MKSSKQWALLTASTLAMSIALVGCGKSDSTETKTSAEQKAAPTPVGVIVAQPQSVEQMVELTGRLAASEESEVRPQTSGVILRRLFAEGSYVQAGQPLYELDSRTNRASLANARATLLQQQANLQSLRVKLGRYQQLVSSNAVSKQDYDDLVGQVNVATAQVEAARAQVKNAEVDLGYSIIRAPISGQTGRSTVTAGALVTANQTNALVKIQRFHPIYMNITQSSTEVLRLRQKLSQGSVDRSNNTNVKLKLEDGSIYPIEGRLAFADASVDAATGSITIRAVFDNPNALLLPGMFGTVQIVQGVIPNAYLIPQVALTRTPTGQATVMVVNSKNIVETRMVETSGTQGSDWIVTSGLNAGDKVIVEGVAKVKTGAEVKPSAYQAKKPTQPVSASSGQTAQAASQATAASRDAQSAQKTTSQP